MTEQEECFFSSFQDKNRTGLERFGFEDTNLVSIEVYAGLKGSFRFTPLNACLPNKVLGFHNMF
jgi:hypothetical protein